MSERSKSFNLIDYINIFLDNRKIIFINAFIVGIITAIIVFFVMDKIFFSSATIKATSKQSGLSGLISSGAVPDLGELGDIAGVGSASSKDLALFENIILSRRCLEETIIKFNIMEEHDYPTMFDAVKGFRNNTLDLKKDKLSGTIEIGIYDKDPKKAQEMVDFIISQLNKINIEINVQDARNNREFIQSRYDLVSGELKQYEDSLQYFQEKNGIAPDLQAQFVYKAELELEAEIKSQEVKLDLLRKILSPTEAEIKVQEDKINSLKSQLNDVKNSPDEGNSLSIKGVPEKVMNFYRLKRDVEIQNKILTTLIPLLEQSKIEENRNTPSVLIVDPANVPDRKVKPKRLTNVAVFSFLTFMISYFVFVFKNKWDYYKLLIKESRRRNDFQNQKS